MRKSRHKRGNRRSKAVPRYREIKTRRFDQSLRKERAPLMEKIKKLVNNDFVTEGMYTEVWEYIHQGRIAIISMRSHEANDFIVIRYYDIAEDKVIKTDVVQKFPRDINNMVLLGSFNDDKKPEPKFRDYND